MSFPTDTPSRTPSPKKGSGREGRLQRRQSTRKRRAPKSFVYEQEQAELERRRLIELKAVQRRKERQQQQERVRQLRVLLEEKNSHSDSDQSSSKQTRKSAPIVTPTSHSPSYSSNGLRPRWILSEADTYSHTTSMHQRHRTRAVNLMDKRNKARKVLETELAAIGSKDRVENELNGITASSSSDKVSPASFTSSLPFLPLGKEQTDGKIAFRVTSCPTVDIEYSVSSDLTGVRDADQLVEILSKGWQTLSSAEREGLLLMLPSSVRSDSPLEHGDVRKAVNSLMTRVVKGCCDEVDQDALDYHRFYAHHSSALIMALAEEKRRLGFSAVIASHTMPSFHMPNIGDANSDTDASSDEEEMYQHMMEWSAIVHSAEPASRRKGLLLAVPLLTFNGNVPSESATPKVTSASKVDRGSISKQPTKKRRVDGASTRKRPRVGASRSASSASSSSRSSATQPAPVSPPKVAIWPMVPRLLLLFPRFDNEASVEDLSKAFYDNPYASEWVLSGYSKESFLNLLLEYLQYPPSTAAGIKFARLASEPKDDVSVHNEKSIKSTVKEDDKKERIPSIVEATDRGADGLGSRYRYVADTYLHMDDPICKAYLDDLEMLFYFVSSRTSEKYQREQLRQRDSDVTNAMILTANTSLIRDRDDSKDSRLKKSHQTVSANDEDETIHFRKQEAQRYKQPSRSFTYVGQDGQKISVAPVSRFNAKGKAREHSLLRDDRPPSVSLLTVVRDAAARLPAGIGTRPDVLELLKHSQFVKPACPDAQLSTVVSSALDRLQAVSDPCVRYLPDHKLWVYLHRNRKEDELTLQGNSMQRRRRINSKRAEKKVKAPQNQNQKHDKDA